MPKNFFAYLVETFRRLHAEEMFRSGYLGLSLQQRAAQRLGKFWLDDWKWICATAVALVALLWR